MLHRGVIARFYLQNELLFVIFIAVVINWISRKFQAIKSSNQIFAAYAFSAILIGAGYKNYSKYSQVSDFGEILMKSFPENSIVLMKGDLPSNTFRYFNLVENRRIDVAFIDTQPMTYDWYLKFQKVNLSAYFIG